jgi:uncharacterized protein YcbK (DUF882 family)
VKALALLVILAGTAAADTKSEFGGKQGEPLRKVDHAKLVGKKPATVINLYNIHTHEWLAVDGKAKSIPHDEFDHFLRCHYTNQPTDMDPKLAGLVLQAARDFKVDRVNIVSGFRSPKYNLMLRKKGHRVARDSQHTYGHAVDFFLPGVSTEQLYDWAMKHQVGGVGKYVSDGFVHMDVGRKRTWIDQ